MTDLQPPATGDDGPPRTPEGPGTQETPETPASYEAAREELVDVVRRLESGGTDLEESLALWERGEQLARACQQWLDGARSRLATTVEADRQD